MSKQKSVPKRPDQFTKKVFDEYVDQYADTIKEIAECVKYDKFVCSMILQDFSILITLIARGQTNLMYDCFSIIEAAKYRSDELQSDKLKLAHNTIENNLRYFARLEAVRYLDELPKCAEDYRKDSLVTDAAKAKSRGRPRKKTQTTKVVKKKCVEFDPMAELGDIDFDF